MFSYEQKFIILKAHCEPQIYGSVSVGEFDKKKLTEKLQRQKDNEKYIVGVLIDKKWLKATSFFQKHSRDNFQSKSNIFNE